MEIIILPVGGINKLASDFKVSRQAVSRALRGKRDTPGARMLRLAALERGGKRYVLTSSKPSHESTR